MSGTTVYDGDALFRLLGGCSDNTPDGGSCLDEVDSGKGYVLYDDYKSCQESWLLLPGFNLLPNGILILVYGIALCWCFFGVAIISDIFMASIEIITSKVKKVKVITPAGTEAYVEVAFWNPTLANLSLMALGSSAPEILLAIIETVSTLGKEPGELGPSTIVGSAAFNLLVISAVCLASVPDGEVRRVKELHVFICTTVFSLWAYIWLFIVYVAWTPDQITIAEALITLVMFPLLLGVSYMFDKKPWQRREDPVEAARSAVSRMSAANPSTTDGKPSGAASVLPTLAEAESGLPEGAQILMPMGGRGGGMAMGGLLMNGDGSQGKAKQASEVQELIISHGAGQTNMSDDEFLAALAAKLNPEQWDAMRYRINARKALTGGKHKAERPGTSQGLKNNAVAPARLQSKSFSRMLSEVNRDKTKIKVGFKSRTFAVMEAEKRVRLYVARWDGDLMTPIKLHYKTVPGTATEGEDYIAASGTLSFEAGDKVKFVDVEIIDDNEYEPDETFYVDLTLDEASRGDAFLASARCEVTIIDDDEPGILMFKETRIRTGNISPHADVTIVRKKGADGVVSAQYRTQDETAFAGTDYVYSEGTVTFEHGQTEANIVVPIFADQWGEDDNKEFSIQLTDPTGGATIGRRRNCAVVVVPDEAAEALAAEAKSKVARSLEQLSIHTSSWQQQFKDAMYPGGEINEVGEEIVTNMDLILHYCSITWKVIFAVVPPTDIWGGWATFVCSLAMVGFVTAIIEQLATLFGCMVGLKDSVTAITFVALGTSLPDTFASKHATVESEHADAAIGNVTGSNSVNVFLGLGIPWTIASVYYAAKDEDYVTPAGAIGFSVTVYTCCACVAVAILFLKRRFDGGELGGGGVTKWGAAVVFVTLWLLFIVLSSVQAYAHVDGFR